MFDDTQLNLTATQTGIIYLVCISGEEGEFGVKERDGREMDAGGEVDRQGFWPIV